LRNIKWRVFNILSWHLPEDSEKNYDKPHSW